eukprot:177008_1
MATPFKQTDTMNQSKLNPIHRLLELSEEKEFVLTWQHIANALNHELYDNIASSLMVIVNGSKRFENTDELLEEIKNKNHIHQDEVNYIRELIERARQFYHSNNGLLEEIKNKNHIHQDEVNYIRELIERARQFYHSNNGLLEEIKNKNHIHQNEVNYI